MNWRTIGHKCRFTVIHAEAWQNGGHFRPIFEVLLQQRGCIVVLHDLGTDCWFCGLPFLLDGVLQKWQKNLLTFVLNLSYQALFCTANHCKSWDLSLSRRKRLTKRKAFNLCFNIHEFKWVNRTYRADRCNSRGRTGETAKPHYGYGAVSHASHWKAPEVKCIYSSILKPVVTELLVFYGQRGRERCTTHWGFENCLFHSGEKKASRHKGLQDFLHRIINYEGEILKINIPKADSLVFIDLSSIETK